jgi:hypothetical protein
VVSVSNKYRFGVAVACLLLLASVVLCASAESNRDVAVSSISGAEQAVASAYVVVLDAERAGANVSGLLVRLNGAADLISEAHAAFDVGSFEEAVRLAGLSGGVGVEVENDAGLLKVEAGNANVDRFWLYLVVSAVAVAVVVCGGYVGYGFFKKWYFRRLLKMKPRLGKA